MAREPSARTDAPWAKIAPCWPEPNASPRGGPEPIPHRPVFEGRLGRLRAGARRQDLPQRSPSPSTCGRRLRDGGEHGVGGTAWRAFFAPLDARGRLEWAAACADGRSAPATHGGRASGNRREAQARRGGWGSTAPGSLWATAWDRRPPPQCPCWRRPWRPWRSPVAAPAALARGPRGASTLQQAVRTPGVRAWRRVALS